LRSDLVAALPLAQEIFASSTRPEREATIVTIGVHPFVVGTADGAEALRRVLENFKNQKLVWVTDVQAVLDVADEKK
jgi:allantoinase